MSAALATAEPVKEHTRLDPERGRLLGLVRALIAFGNDLVAMLQSRNTPTAPAQIARRFGVVTIAMIITRITRGLMIAAALERRLLHPRPRPSGPIRPAEPTLPRPPKAPRPPQPDESEELLGKLPTAREIAARIRNRKTGAVIADICRDLGINPEHPLWRDINAAIIFNGGNTVKLLRIWLTRGHQLHHLPLLPEEMAYHDQLVAQLAQPP